MNIALFTSLAIYSILTFFFFAEYIHSSTALFPKFYLSQEIHIIYNSYNTKREKSVTLSYLSKNL
jgi:hypothetical protein